MTETLRVQEEVGSLRAIVDTMRMRTYHLPSPSYDCRRVVPSGYARWTVLTSAEVMTDRPASRSPVSIATRVPIAATSSPALPLSRSEAQHGSPDRSVEVESESSFSTANDGVIVSSGADYIDPLGAFNTFDGSRPATDEPEGGEEEAASIVESIVFSPHHPPSGTSSIVTSPAEEDSSFVPLPSPLARHMPRLNPSTPRSGNNYPHSAGSQTSRSSSRYDSYNIPHTRHTTTSSSTSHSHPSMTENTDGTGSSSLAAAYNAALRNMSTRGAQRSASVVGGVGVVVGQPMGLPRMSVALGGASGGGNPSSGNVRGSERGSGLGVGEVGELGSRDATMGGGERGIRGMGSGRSGSREST